VPRISTIPPIAALSSSPPPPPPPTPQFFSIHSTISSYHTPLSSYSSLITHTFRDWFGSIPDPIHVSCLIATNIAHTIVQSDTCSPRATSLAVLQQCLLRIHNKIVIIHSSTRASTERPTETQKHAIHLQHVTREDDAVPAGGTG
jgi:hypothetical protein